MSGLYHCTFCRIVVFEPEEARMWGKAELINIFKTPKIPGELLRSPALFCGLIKTEHGEQPMFLSSESDGFKATEKIKQENQRFSICRVCRSPRLFNEVGESWQT